MKHDKTIWFSLVLVLTSISLACERTDPRFEVSGEWVIDNETGQMASLELLKLRYFDTADTYDPDGEWVPIRLSGHEVSTIREQRAQRRAEEASKKDRAEEVCGPEPELNFRDPLKLKQWDDWSKCGKEQLQPAGKNSR